MTVATAKKQRIAAIDYGMKRIGLALSDEMLIIATPETTLLAQRRMEDTVQHVASALETLEREKNFDLQEVVVGMPLLMNGKVGLVGDEVQHFVELLRQVLTVPVITWDERLTSVQAERAMREGALTRKKRSKLVDAVAAVILLQSYLHHKSGPITAPLDIPPRE